MYDEDDDDRFECDKFEDCTTCRNRFHEKICMTCYAGEEFEEEDIDEVDKYFQGRL